MDYPIPHASKKAWNSLRSTHQPCNLGLIFDRFILQDWKDEPDKEAKKKALKEVLSASERIDKKLLEQYNLRWEAIVKAAQGIILPMQTDWRFLTGIGRKGPLETGFTFQRYGVPVLPGSSVKGLARAGARLDLGVTDDLAAEKIHDFLAVFGRAAQSSQDKTASATGGAIFFDAIPLKAPTLILDILNPHFPDYYGDDPKHPTHAPTDSQNPKPVNFLTVAPGQVFRFAVGWRLFPQNSPAEIQETTRLRQRAIDWLKKGLQELGAGAKTSAGYGYFSESSAPIQQIQPEPVEEDQTAAVEEAQPVITRRGVITAMRPDKHFGALKDAETGQEHHFSTSVVQGNTPRKQTNVEFDLQGEKVIRVKSL